MIFTATAKKNKAYYLVVEHITLINISRTDHLTADSIEGFQLLKGLQFLLTAYGESI